MNDIGIFNESNKDIELLDEIEKLVNYYVNYLKLENTVFNIIFVNNETIRKINREYRNIDRETDVISFALEDNNTFPKGEFRVLGDIYISIDKAISQKDEYNHSLKRELCFLVTHGLLHLLGYDHMTKEDEKEMFDLQKELLDSYGIKE